MEKEARRFASLATVTPSGWCSAVAPWKLPISELRWGHWACPSSRRSVVWIEWRGRTPLTLVLVNGLPAADVRVDDDRVRIGSSELLLSDTRMLHARTLADVLGGLRAVAGRLPASWRRLEDRKWISRGAVGAETGWAIHETVRFP